MVLADTGADVVQVDRSGLTRPSDPTNILARGQRSVVLNLSSPADRGTLLELIAASDGLIDPCRPGAVERPGSPWCWPGDRLARRGRNARCAASVSSRAATS